MAVLLVAMGALVGVYYGWPPGRSVLLRYADWQRSGGVIQAGLTAGFAGGVLSEVCLVYASARGRWSVTHGENMLFRFLVFFVNGMMVYEFYNWQAVWWGQGVSWRVLVPKIGVDQFVYTPLISVPYSTLLFRWQALRYSGPALGRELDRRFVLERMLPVLVANWMFWIPGVTLIYSLPLVLQMPLSIFATAIWSLLLAGVARPQGPPIMGTEAMQIRAADRSPELFADRQS